MKSVAIQEGSYPILMRRFFVAVHTAKEATYKTCSQQASEYLEENKQRRLARMTPPAKWPRRRVGGVRLVKYKWLTWWVICGRGSLESSKRMSWEMRTRYGRCR